MIMNNQKKNCVQCVAVATNKGNMKKEKPQNNKTILEIKEDQDFQEKIKSNKDKLENLRTE